jgi:hypothetical protein
MFLEGIVSFFEEILAFLTGLVPSGILEFLEGIFGNILG